MSSPAATPPVAVIDSPAAFERAHAALVQQRRIQMALFGGVFAATLAATAWVGEVRLDVLIEDLPGITNYISDIAPTIRAGHVVEDVREWYWALDTWLVLLWDTVLIAFTGTVLGTVGAFCLGFLASRNLMRNRWIYFTARRVSELARGVPELVYAMMFVFAFGLGPFAGVLAIAIHTMGALGKLYAEVNENVDPGPIDGLHAVGANWIETIRYAVVPQVLPNYASYTLLRFEISVRSASVIGFVGAGGIGQELMFVIRQFVYSDISAILILIVLSVTIIDISCEQLRHRLIGKASLA